MSLIKGIHHVAVKPRKSQYEAVMKFYTELLELPVECTWGDPEYPCAMVSTGDGSRLEILPGDHFVARRNTEQYNKVVLNFLMEG